MDPSFWWDNQLVVKQIDDIPLDSIKDKKFYLSTADKFENFESIPEVFKANINSHELFNAKLKNKGISPNNLQFDYFKEENHWTVALLSLYNGLQFVFKDLQEINLNTESLDKITAHYKTIYNGKFSPPEGIINKVGYNYISQNMNKKALQTFLLNTKNYPNSSNAYDSLGEVYMLLGDKKNAINSYKKSLKLDGGNENALKMIKKLNTN